jgi:hypothetical protein
LEQNEETCRVNHKMKVERAAERTLETKRPAELSLHGMEMEMPCYALERGTKRPTDRSEAGRPTELS